MEIKQRFGAAVRKRRLELGVSQEELSMRIELDQGYVSQIETGHMNVTLETADRVAKALALL